MKNLFGSLRVLKFTGRFEALLGAINSALDLLSRISGIAYDEQTPVSLNKFSSKKNLSGIVDIFRRAKSSWIDTMKNYRDCFVHYTPVDHRPFVTIYKLKKNLKIWCKIPINPNVREIEGFKFSRRLDILRYSISIYHNLLNLDEEVADQIQETRRKGQFPKRMRNLFFVGERQKRDINHDKISKSRDSIPIKFISNFVED